MENQLVLVHAIGDEEIQKMEEDEEGYNQSFNEDLPFYVIPDLIIHHIQVHHQDVEIQQGNNPLLPAGNLENFNSDEENDDDNAANLEDLIVENQQGNHLLPAGNVNVNLQDLNSPQESDDDDDENAAILEDLNAIEDNIQVANLGANNHIDDRYENFAALVNAQNDQLEEDFDDSDEEEDINEDEPPANPWLGPTRMINPDGLVQQSEILVDHSRTVMHLKQDIINQYTGFAVENLELRAWNGEIMHDDDEILVYRIPNGVQVIVSFTVNPNDPTVLEYVGLEEDGILNLRIDAFQHYQQ